MIWPVILSGGAGTRLWPVSRAAAPKQFHALAGSATLLQATAQRVANAIGFHAPLVVANEAQAGTVASQLAAIDCAPAAILLEPASRNTAPAIALAAHWIAARDSAGLMLVMPSDHVIADLPAFHAAIARATPVVADGWLATFGIAPTAPETGYGYIKVGETLADGVHRVARFVEKPDRRTAEAYLESGHHVWNGGIFLMRADRYLAALAAHAPEIAAAAAAAFADASAEGALVRPGCDAFRACPSDSIDYAVMEKDSRVAVVPVAMGWSDIGSWDALAELGEADGDGNILTGDVIAIDTRDCFVRSDGPLVATVGVAGLRIVVTRDAILIAGAGKTQAVKAVVDRLDAAGRREHLDPPPGIDPREPRR